MFFCYMMNIQPKISVCLATYNGASYIKEQLVSILNQLEETDEIIVSDDNSTDNTLEIIKSLEDPRINIFINSNPKGYTPNFENALSKASGKYIFLSDQDDIWKGNKVEVSLSYLKNYNFIVSDAEIINDKGEVIEESFYMKRKPYYSFWRNIYKFGFLGCCFAFDRKILKTALPFPPNHKLCTHDNWIFLVASFDYSYKILEDKLIYYRRHSNNTSTGGLKKTTSIWFKIKYRIYLIINIIKR